MNANQLLRDLIKHIEFNNGPVYIGWEDTQSWGEGVLKQLLKAGLLIKTTKASSLQCNGCHYQCFKEVLFTEKTEGTPIRAFIVCEEPEMQDQMGRIPVPLEHLKRWKTSAMHWAKVVGGILGFNDNIESKSSDGIIRLGMLKGPKGRRWISLVKPPLALEVNQRQIPIEDALYFEGLELTLDVGRIDYTLVMAPLPDAKGYTPTTDKREARKAEIQAMYRGWQDEYPELKKKHPGKSDKWISERIAANPDIAKGRSAETIRKIMKL